MARDKSNPHMREKPCRQCGRVGHWHTFCSDACKQKAYRERKREYTDTHARTVSAWLVEMFGENDCAPIWNDLNSITGQSNIKAVNAALEKIVYLTQSKVRKETAKARRIK